MTIKKLFELASKTNRHRVILSNPEKIMIINQNTFKVVSFWNGGQITEDDLPRDLSISCSIQDAAKALRLRIK